MCWRRIPTYKTVFQGLLKSLSNLSDFFRPLPTITGIAIFAANIKSWEAFYIFF